MGAHAGDGPQSLSIWCNEGIPTLQLVTELAKFCWLETTQAFKTLRLRSAGLDQYDIPILYYVLLALRHHLAFCFHFSFISILFNRVVVVDNDLNECLLEIYPSLDTG